jgi:hypothetical protein
MKKGSSDDTYSDLDRKTITLIESIAKQVRTNIDGGMLPNIDAPGPQSRQCDVRRSEGLLRAWHARAKCAH